MIDMTDEFRQAYFDMDKFISEVIAGKEVGLDLFVKGLPKTYSMKSMSKEYDKAWVIGFRTCLASVKRAAEKAKVD